MTRRIFGWLFPVAALPAAAQTVVMGWDTVPPSKVLKSIGPNLEARHQHNGGTLRLTPQNGQCPVCGTQATAFRPNHPTHQEISGGNGLTLAIPKSTEVICTHCRVHFEQDADK